MIRVPNFLLVAGALACGCHRDAAPAPNPTPEPALEVKTTRAFRGPITRFVGLPAEVRPYQQATLYAKVPGYLKTIAVDKGDQVEEGKLLAEIEVPELLAELARYKAEVEVAAIDFRRLSESEKKAPDLVIPQAIDNARSKFEVAKANLVRAETLLNYSKITAPFGGVVTRRMVDPGAFVPAATAGSAAQNAALLTLMDFNRVRVQVAVPEIESVFVAAGQPVKVSVEGLPGQVFEGTVTRLAYALDESTKTMLAEIELPNPKRELRPGMYATARLGVQTKNNALLLPLECLLTERSGASVFAAVDGKAKKLKVQTGFNDGTHVEIAAGLDPAQEVIVLGKRALVDGQPITPGK